MAPPRRSRRLALKRVSIGDLPEPALRRILLTATSHDNILRFVAACARVCCEWWRVVGSSAAYGRGLTTGRETVLKKITAQLEKTGDTLDLTAHFRGGTPIGDAGAAVLVATLQVTTNTSCCLRIVHRTRAHRRGLPLQALARIRFTGLVLWGNHLTAVGVRSLVPALRRQWGPGGLRKLASGGVSARFDVAGARGLGDAGVAALTGALPSTLEDLSIGGAGCGDEGFVALAAALPALTRLRILFCSHNPAVGGRGWAAVAGALPSLPALETVAADCCTGIKSEGAVALAAAIPQCPRLRSVHVGGSLDLGEDGKAALKRAVNQARRAEFTLYGWVRAGQPVPPSDEEWDSESLSEDE